MGEWVVNFLFSKIMKRNSVLMLSLLATALISSCSSAVTFNSNSRSSSSEAWMEEYQNYDARLVAGDTFTDERDSKIYKWVKMAGQFWMAENLNYNASGSVCYDNLESNCSKYGRLYDWTTAMALEAKYETALYGTHCKDYCYKIDAALLEDGICPLDCYEPSVIHRGVCPAGWHLPSDEEWSELVSFVDSQEKDHVNNNAGIKLKAVSGWSDYESVSGNGTDEYGFSALPGGRSIGSGYFEVGFSGNWWGVTERDSANAMNRRIANHRHAAYRYFSEKNSRFSVRCIKD